VCPELARPLRADSGCHPSHQREQVRRSGGGISLNERLNPLKPMGEAWNSPCPITLHPSYWHRP
jgi:hypothetical protein